MAPPPPVVFDPIDPAEQSALTAMGHYFEELAKRFPSGFDPGPVGEWGLANLRPPEGLFVVGRVAVGHPGGGNGGGRTVACGGLQTIGPAVGEVKRMWVDADLRGQGTGPALLADLERRSRGLGHRVLRLDTNSVLDAAVRMYRRAGYTEIQRYNDNPYPDLFFEKTF